MATEYFSKQHLKKSALAFVFILAFLLELAAFGAFGLITDILPVSRLMQNILWALLVVALVYFWVTYMAPKAKHRLDWNKYYPAKAALYSVAAISIYYHLGIVWASIFIGLSLAVEFILYPYRNTDLQAYFGNKTESKKNGKRRAARD